MGRLMTRNRAVTAAPKIRSRVKAFPMTRSASSRFPRPRSMELSGAPPVPHRLAKPMIMEITGTVRPSPVRARWPGSSPR